jgi:hypothetical protein
LVKENGLKREISVNSKVIFSKSTLSFHFWDTPIGRTLPFLGLPEKMERIGKLFLIYLPFFFLLKNELQKGVKNLFSLPPFQSVNAPLLGQITLSFPFCPFWKNLPRSKKKLPQRGDTPTIWIGKISSDLKI